LTTALSRFALALTVVFMVGIAVIHAQPYDDSDLREFLAPKGNCAAPCFMGITPGTTRLPEALAILEAHEWVGQIETKNLPFVTWTWSGLQPKNIDPASKGALYASNRNEIVWNIAIRTTFPVASMYLLNDGPPITDEDRRARTADNLFIGVHYPNLSLLMFTQLRCPTTVYQFWSSWLGLEFRRPADFPPRVPTGITLIC
jgi:hypothetical protein